VLPLTWTLGRMMPPRMKKTKRVPAVVTNMIVAKKPKLALAGDADMASLAEEEETSAPAMEEGNNESSTEESATIATETPGKESVIVVAPIVVLDDVEMAPAMIEEGAPVVEEEKKVGTDISSESVMVMEATVEQNNNIIETHSASSAAVLDVEMAPAMEEEGAPLAEAEDPSRNRFRVEEAYSWDKNTQRNCAMWDAMSSVFYRRMPEIKLLSDGMVEFPLERFAPLYQRLRFRDFRLWKTKIQWRLKVVFFFPNRTMVVAKWPREIQNLRAKLGAFYKKTFYVVSDDHKSIDECIDRHPSIVIVARQTNSDEAAYSLVRPSKNTSGKMQQQQYHIVGAITYVMSSYTVDLVSLEEPAAQIIWFATCSKSRSNLSHLPNKCWSGNGFGIFLISLVIKRCACQAKKNPDGSLPPLKLYLQNQPLMDHVTAYYARMGFVQINDENDGDGKELIPEHLSKRFDKFSFVSHDKSQMKLLCLQFPVVESSTEQETGPVQETSTFAVNVSSTSPGVPHVLVANVSASSPESETASVAIDLSGITSSSAFAGKGIKAPPNPNNRPWCRFPPSQFLEDIDRITADDFRQATDGLKLLEWLLPPSSEHHLLSTDKHTIHGEVMFERRILEGKSNGKEWMSTGKIEAGLALLMADGRYSKDVAIIAPSYSGLIAAGHASELKYREMMEKNTNEFGSVDSMELARASANTNDCLNQVLQKIIGQHPGLMGKKILVFVADEGECHWTVTFVFNPGTIDKAWEREDDHLRCCFYRYCGYNSKGGTLVAHTHGLKWFLNLLFSHDRMVTENPEATDLTFYQHFGKISDGAGEKYLHGTEYFPSLRFYDANRLPQQRDGHNCGVAILAATAILLRDLIGVADSGQQAFAKLFHHKATPMQFKAIEREFFVEIPAGTLHGSRRVADKRYFSQLKAELYVFFDRLAELEHVTTVRRRYPKAAIDRHYLEVKASLKWPLLTEISGEAAPAAYVGRGTDHREPRLPEVTQEEGAEDDSNYRQTAAADTLLNLAVASTPKPATKKLRKAVQRKLPTHQGGAAQETLPSNSPMMNVEAMNKFVRQRFEQWEWHTDEEHKNLVKELYQELDITTGRLARKELRDYINQAKAERQYFKRMLEMEYFLTSDAILVGLKYNKETKKFTASTETKVSDPDNPGGTKSCFKQLELEDENWVRDVFSEEMIEKAMAMASAGHEPFMQIPGGVKTKLFDKAVVRVKCIPYSTSTVVDTKALAKLRMKKKKQRLAEMKMKPKWGREIIELEDSLKQKRDFEVVPKMIVENPEQWLAQIEGGATIMVQLDWVIAQFGNTYAEDVRASRRAFIDVPVGDNKPSHLNEWPTLIVDGLPENKFRQPEGMNLCLPNALASVLHVLGFDKSAEEINKYGEEHLGMGATDTFTLVYNKARSCLPSWVQMENVKNPEGFGWETNLKDRTIMLAVLTTSDGHRSHGVAIHGGLIYDANEANAILLCKDGLDYCSSTPTKRCEFVKFHKVMLLSYDGDKKSRIQKFTRPLTPREMMDNLMIQH